MKADFNSHTLHSSDKRSIDPQHYHASDPRQSQERLDVATSESQKFIAKIYIEQAQVYCQEQNWHKAVAACRNALKVTPQNVDAYRILGDILHLQGKQGEALGIYAKALCINSDAAMVYLSIGNLYVKQSNWHKALEYYQQAVIIDPHLTEAHRNLARVWEELGNSDRALECFCTAIELDSAILEPEDYFNFGRELYARGKLQESKILFLHGVKLNPFAEERLTQLVEILEELEEWQEAVVYYHRLMSLPKLESDRARESVFNARSSEDSANLKYKPISKLLSATKFSQNPAIAQKTQGNSSQSRESNPNGLFPKSTYKSLNLEANSQPNSAVSWNNLGSLYAQEQEWQEAISCYEEALKLDRRFSKSYRNLARVYQSMGEELKASLCWHAAFDTEPDRIRSQEYFELANQLLDYKQTEKAIACLHRTVELNPNFQAARDLLDELNKN